MNAVPDNRLPRVTRWLVYLIMALIAFAAVVLALIGASGKPVPGAPRRDTAQPGFAITGPLGERAGLPRVLPEQVYGLLDAV